MKLIEGIREYIIQHPYDIGAYNDFMQAVTHKLKAGQTLAHEYNKNIRPEISYALRTTTDVKLMGDLSRVYKHSLLLDAMTDFDAYLQYVEWQRDKEKKFYAPRRKIIKPLVDAMQALMDDELDLLTISLPPGIGKSTLGIFFLSWIMGKYPHSPNLVSAHSGLLTRSFYDGVLSILKDPQYLWKDVFSSKVYGTNSKEETIDIDCYHRFSTLTCRAINASLTGATRCEKLLYADDLCSGIEQALSRDRMDSLWTKYTNDLKSRKKQGAKQLHIATRWSVHDVIGRLQRMYEDDPRCKFIKVPALNDQGESNFNYAYGVGFDTEYFMDMKNNLDDASFKALFMNEPIEREGQLYHESQLRRYFDLPDGEPDAIISVCDTKDTGKDSAVLPVAYVYGNDYYIEDCIVDNSKPELIHPRYVQILMKHKVQMCQFEHNNGGGHVAKDVDTEIKAKGGSTHITTKYTHENKEIKIVVNSPWVKEHCLFKDESLYHKNSDYGRLISGLTTYTMIGKNKHDDVPDCMAMLALFAQSLVGTKVTVFNRPF